MDDKETGKKPNNPQAFPCDSRESRTFAGMTLRDYFASKAMQSIVSGYNRLDTTPTMKYIANKAYFMADMMLKERENGKRN